MRSKIGKISGEKNQNNHCFWEDGTGNSQKIGWSDQIQESQLNLNFRWKTKTFFFKYKYVLCDIWNIILKMYSLFHWNSNLTRCPVLLCMKFGNLVRKGHKRNFWGGGKAPYLENGLGTHLLKWYKSVHVNFTSEE